MFLRPNKRRREDVDVKVKWLAVVNVIASLITFCSAGPSSAQTYEWSGFYAGGSIGSRTANSDWKTECIQPLLNCATGNAIFSTRFQNANPSSLNSTALRLGGHLGYNFQLESWVVGLESDASWANNERARTGIPGTYLAGAATADKATVKNSWDVSVRARGGFLLTPEALLYATGGVSWLHKKVTAECNTPLFPVGWCIAVNKGSDASTPIGWTVGTGLEWMFAPHWLIRGEYRYASYGSSRATFFSNVPVDSIRVRTDRSVHAAIIGFSYLFN